MRVGTIVKDFTRVKHYFRRPQKNCQEDCATRAEQSTSQDRRARERKETPHFHRHARLDRQYGERDKLRDPSARSLTRMTALLRRVLRSLSSGGVEDTLAQPERFRSRFHEFVGADVFDCALERHAQRGFELDTLAIALASHVR